MCESGRIGGVDGSSWQVYCLAMERMRYFFSILLLQTAVTVLLSFGLSLSVRAEVNDQFAYNSAFQLIRDRQFEQAIDAMIFFTHQYPKSELLVDAIFWVGQTEAVLAKDEQAIKTFAYIAKTFPDYRRTTQAQVKLGKLLIKNGRLNEGLSILAKVIDLAPSSVEAGLAEREIQETGASNAVHFLDVYQSTISQMPAPKWVKLTKSDTSTQNEIFSQSQQRIEPDGQICIFATINGLWDYNNRAYVEEAKRRGLDCGVGVSSDPVSDVSNRIAEMSILQLCRIGTQKKDGRFVETTGYGKNHLALALKRGVNCVSFMNKREVIDSTSQTVESPEIDKLRAELIALKAERDSEQQAISQDTQSPIIRITSANSDGARGTISGTATDNTGIAEVLIDGQVITVDSSGRFTTSTFIPSGGKDIQITAYDLKGLSTTETVRLERSTYEQSVSRLAAVNPFQGPKQKPSRDRAALIIGLEQYAAAPPADYASRDAQMFADYAREKLGIAPENIKVLTDAEATRSGLLRALKVWLPQAVQPNKTDLYVFYAGHGMASDDGESAYIVPYGADTLLLEDTAISRERFYEEIGAAKPRTATFFFDNCYAGTTRSEERLLAQRPLSIRVQESPVPDNYLIFTAGESNQTAGVLDDVKHGRFSYFVFKGLEGDADANADGKISADELHAYVRESVGRFSAGAQTPTMLGDGSKWVLR